MNKKNIIIIGAAGRDFHNFNTYYRNKEEYNVVAFTAAQIPDIDGRKYPTELAGELYPEGIPIFPQEDLPKLIEELDYYKNSKEDLKTKLKESISSKNELNAIVENLQNENQSQKALLEESNKKIQRLQTKTKILEKQKSNIINKKVEDLQSRLNAELSKNESLAKSNAELSKNLEDYSKIILENKQLTEQLNNLNKNKLIESKKIEQEKSLQENKIKELQQKITLLEQQAKKTENIEDRFSKLAFDPIGNIKVVAENFKRNDLSQEDIDLYNALTNK